MFERALLLQFVLEPGPTSGYHVDIVFPPGASSLSEIDVTTVPVAEVVQSLRKAAAHGDYVTVDLSTCGVVAAQPANGGVAPYLEASPSWRDFSQRHPMSVRDMEEDGAQYTPNAADAAALPPLMRTGVVLQPSFAGAAHSLPKPLSLHVEGTATDLAGPLESNPVQYNLWLYEMILLSTGLLAERDPSIVRAVLDVMRPALHVSEADHRDVITTFLPPQVAKDKVLDSFTPSSSSELLRAPEVPVGVREAVAKLVRPSQDYVGLCTRSNTSSAVRKRQSLLWKTRSMMRHRDSSDSRYPVFIRAFLLTCLFATEVLAEDGWGANTTDMTRLIMHLMEAWEVPEDLVPFCRLHAVLLVQRRLSDPQFTSGIADLEALHMRLLTMLTHLLGGYLSDHFVDPDAVQTAHQPYYDIVLGGLLEFSVMPMLMMMDTLCDEKMLATTCVLLKATCQACSRFGVLESTIALDANSPGRDGLNTADPESVFRFLLCELLCAPLFKDLQVLGVEDISFSRATANITQSHNKAIDYATVLADVVPDAPCMLISGVVRLMSFVAHRKWGKLVERGIVPDAFGTHVQVMFECLQRIHTNTCAVVRDKASVSAAVGRAVDAYLSWLRPLFDIKLEEAASQMTSYVSGVLDRMPWDGSGLGPNQAVPALFTMFTNLLSPFQHCIAPLPASLFIQFLSSSLNQLSAFASRVCDSANLAKQVAALTEHHIPPAARNCPVLTLWKTESLQLNKMGAGLFSLQEGGIVHRLNTLIAVQREAVKYVEYVGGQYGVVRAVTGVQPLDEIHVFMEQVSSINGPMFSCMRDLCHCLAVLHVRRYKKDYFDKMFIIDVKKYKQLKKDDANSASTLPRLWPEATIGALLDALDASLSALLPSIADGGCRSDVIGHCTVVLLCELAELIINGGEGRFFSPADYTSLLGDVDEIVDYFASTAPPEGRHMQQDVDMLADGLRTLLKDVFHLSSEVLVESTRSWPDEPRKENMCCKYLAKCILLHRKDKVAKRFVGFRLLSELT